MVLSYERSSSVSDSAPLELSRATDFCGGGDLNIILGGGEEIGGGVTGDKLLGGLDSEEVVFLLCLATADSVILLKRASNTLWR